jgi:hypothetical protein
MGIGFVLCHRDFIQSPGRFRPRTEWSCERWSASTLRPPAMKETFSMIPAPPATAWFFGGFCLLMLCLLGLFAYLGYSSRHVTFEVTAGALSIRGDLYGRRIPLASLDLATARTLDLTREPEYRPRLRTNGTALPGYAAGWFRLVNGEKCLAFLTDQRRAVYVRTREGYSLLLSCAEGEALLQELRARAASGVH